jgi:hypothetical protein
MAKKVILIILGGLLGLCGLGALCGGGVLLAFVGTSGNFHSGLHTISTPTVGFVADPTKIQNSTDVRVSGTSITLKVDGQSSSKPLFIGVGPADQVDGYLSGSPYESVTNIDFSPFALKISTVDGAAAPAAPGDQAFWLAQATGSNPHLSWKIVSGDYKVVVMNEDASPVVRLDVRIGEQAPVIGGVGIGFLIGGIVVALVGLALLIWGIRTRRRPPNVATAYPGSSSYPSSYPATYQSPQSPYPSAPPPPGGTYPPPPGGTYPPPPGGTYPPPPGGTYPPPDPYAAPDDPTSPPPSSSPPSTGWQPGPPDDPTRS